MSHFLYDPTSVAQVGEFADAMDDSTNAVVIGASNTDKAPLLFRKAVRAIQANTGNPAVTGGILANLINRRALGYGIQDLVPEKRSLRIGAVPRIMAAQNNPDLNDNILVGSLLGLARRAVDNAIASGLVSASSAEGLRGAIRADFVDRVNKLGLTALGDVDSVGAQIRDSTPGFVASAAPAAPLVVDQPLPDRHDSIFTVAELQDMIRQVLGDDFPVDGVFSSRTEDSLKTLQTVLGLTPDGVVGPQTTASLLSLFGKK